MPSIQLRKLGKKFRNEWIFRGVELEIPAGSRMVILGGNGSGKSTLLQVISGFVMPNEGSVSFSSGGKDLEERDALAQISFASPYLQLIEEFSAAEIIDHVQVYKPFRNKLRTAEVLDLIGLSATGTKPVKQFSSGMKQRLKLGMAILADTQVLLLDEPVSNLDREAIAWYQQMITAHAGDRTIIVCSNAIGEEYAYCDRQLNVMDYKPAR